ncbi:Transposase IS200 like protein [Caulifigura coniformis]|uniref:Transposase IS200 like protein n=1 Tax=Caulifigura coniformis TaxID=2527983 RepID=A0A517S8I1_9PLAN|nr:IS200/IS605 family transposase [Caulifigura coniformis]QDT52441.1 Transposase IS200 like protein [Caulifigura coniformis]
MAGSFASLHIHIVFSTKERRPILTPRLRDLVFPYIAGIVHAEKGHLVEAGGVDDHVHLLVHLLVQLHQQTSVADCARLIKSNSSKWLRENHDDRWLGWQDGYGAFSVSQSSVSDVRDYIRTQEQHHAKTSFQDEFRALLTRHKIEFNEQYIWA